MGFYGAVVGISMAYSSAKKASAPKPAPVRPDFHTEKAVTSTPGVEDDGFEEFICDGDENVEKWFASLEEEE